MFTSRASREFSLGVLLIILILVVPAFINAVQSAYTPTTIASASLPVRGNFPDWLQALTWMNNNLPSTSVVFAWWDYGYWISVNTGLHTLADNGTGNSTQIQIIATGLMLNESMAVNLLHQYGVTHVALFISYNYQSGNSPLCSSTAGAPPVCGYGDDSKWYWMVRIGNGTQLNRSEEHTSELQSRQYLVCRLLLEKKKLPAQQAYRRLICPSFTRRTAPPLQTLFNPYCYPWSHAPATPILGS